MAEVPRKHVGLDESPIPRRTSEQQSRLLQRLVDLDTLAEQLTLLLSEECRCYTDADGNPVVDPVVIAESRDDLYDKDASTTDISTWCLSARDVSVSRQFISNLKTGKRFRADLSVCNALADFWRIDARVFDQNLTTQHLTELLGLNTNLTDADQEIMRLMNDIGLRSIQAREISSALDDSTRANKQALKDILLAIAEDQKTHLRRN
ncbi:hypothetical protein GCM10022222_51070 [Amycolatopsis ultiminotia]|uniref:Uncharacterized protein n=1 Tax=Amycolatopsis ultiminotia TaxID=543629 RepID=A0ABP6X3Y0_9PSEU